MTDDEREREREALAQARAAHIERLRCAVLYLTQTSRRGAVLAVLEAIDFATREDESEREYRNGYRKGFLEGRETLREELARGVTPLTTADPPREPRLPDGERMLPQDDDKIIH